MNKESQVLSDFDSRFYAVTDASHEKKFIVELTKRL